MSDESRNAITNTTDQVESADGASGAASETSEPLASETTQPAKRKLGERHWSDADRRRHSAILKKVWKERKRNPMDPDKAEPAEPPDDKRVRAGQTEIERYNRYPQELQEQYNEFLSTLYTDLGGEEELSTLEKSMCKKIAQLEVLISLFMSDMSIRGTLTHRGKIRSTLDAYYKAVDRHERLSKQIGLKRRTKKVQDTIEGWMARKKAGQS